MMAEEICWFDELGTEDIASAGGNGANLGEVTRAGLPVPRASCTSGIDSISVLPDAADRTRRIVAAAKRRRLLPDAARR
jgi:pyruvate,water dikinase